MAKGSIHGATDGGVTGKHEPTGRSKLLVAPATSDQSNTAQLPAIPVACFRVDDIRFAFDSSFVNSDPADEKNDIRSELKLLVGLLKEHPGSPLSIFGHADPVGSDDYNKQLSGRRATVIYALLIFNSDPNAAVGLWQEVARQEKWGVHQRQTMQTFTGRSSGTADGTLFKEYMQKLTPAELKLGKRDFLAQGADPKGKGDFQGCSEFNPVLIFSTKRNHDFERRKDKTARNDANSPNRRVMVLLFRQGSKIEVAKWPCPRATEGVAACKKRFFADGETRRTERLRDIDRKFVEKEDTFACRFYQQLLTNSPCESPLSTVKIRLFDPQARPLPFAPCLITEAGKKPQPARATGAPPTPLGTTVAGTPGSRPAADKQDGFVTLRVLKLPATVNLKWSRAKASEGASAPLPRVGTDLENSYKFEFDMDVTLDTPDADPRAASPLRLKNLGYAKLPAPNRAFQHDYKTRFPDIVEDGTLDTPTINAIRTAHDGGDPVLKAGSQIAVKR